MARIRKFIKDDRVRLNSLANQNGLWTHENGPAPYGIVTTNGRSHMVRVKLDGHKSASDFHEDYLRLVKRIKKSRMDVIEELVAALLKPHCTESDDHDLENCRKCQQMKEEIVGLIRRLLRAKSGNISGSCRHSDS